MVGIPVSMREAKFVIKMADREGDEELCYDEFVDFVLGADPHPNGSGTEETETGKRRAAEKESAGTWNTWRRRRSPRDWGVFLDHRTRRGHRKMDERKIPR